MPKLHPPTIPPGGRFDFLSFGLVAVLLLLAPLAHAAKVSSVGRVQTSTQTNSGLPLLGRSTSLPALPSISRSVTTAVLVTNRPLVVSFNPVPSGWFTNTAMTQTSTRSGTNGGWIWDTNIVVTPRLAFPAFTNYLLTLTTGTNIATAWTNRTGIVTNRGPVTFSVSPTNQYLFTMWGFAADGQMRYLDQAPFPSAPVNVITFILSPIFSDTLERPDYLWTPGTNFFVFSVTNWSAGNRFMRASAKVLQDDFTPKTFTLGNTFQLAP